MSTLKKCFTLGLAGLLSAWAVGCSKHGSDVKLVKAGTLTTCTNLPHAPFEFERDRTIVGFDVDLVDLMAKKLGVKRTFVDTSFENLKTGALLESGQCDLVAGSLTITEERRKNVDFSEPYFEAHQVLVVKRGSGITDLASLKASGKPIGAQANTIGEDFIKGKGFQPISFESTEAVLLALRSGRVDAIIEDQPAIQNWMKESAHSNFQIAAQLESGEKIGFAVKKGNGKLLAVINDVVAQARADGTYEQLRGKWFGQSLGAVPAPANPQ
ncbi:ABC transporter substrate-binding protein [Pendulispora brunnea]|uniref:ABC transporter substrate-binding protein n=1 Tax=Pendulispora brunnea TaxID=2905690 RepID=A0ABZ2KRD6_9BACT